MKGGVQHGGGGGATTQGLKGFLILGDHDGLCDHVAGKCLLILDRGCHEVFDNDPFRGLADDLALDFTPILENERVGPRIARHEQDHRKKREY